MISFFVFKDQILFFGWRSDVIPLSKIGFFVFQRSGFRRTTTTYLLSLVPSPCRKVEPQGSRVVRLTKQINKNRKRQNRRKRHLMRQRRRVATVVVLTVVLRQWEALLKAMIQEVQVDVEGKYLSMKIYLYSCICIWFISYQKWMLVCWFF
jgi:hypothetical protein